MAEVSVLLRKMVEHQNQNQPNPGPQPDEKTVYTYLSMILINVYHDTISVNSGSESNE